MSDAQQTAKEQTGQVADTAREQTGRVAGTAKGQAQQVTDTARTEAREVLTTAADQAKVVLDEVTADVTAKADEQAGRLGERLHDLSQELQSMADDSQEQGLATAAVRALGEQSERLADRLTAEGTAGVLDDVRRYARNNAGSFLLGAVIAGVAAGRLTRGAKDQKQKQEQQRRVDTYVDETVPVEAVGVPPAPAVPVEPYPAAPQAGVRR